MPLLSLFLVVDVAAVVAVGVPAVAVQVAAVVVGFPCCSFPLGFPKFLVLRRLVEYVVFRVCSALARSCLPKAEAAVEEIVWE